jgi:hypothetical protein
MGCATADRASEQNTNAAKSPVNFFVEMIASSLGDPF